MVLDSDESSCSFQWRQRLYLRGLPRQEEGFAGVSGNSLPTEGGFVHVSLPQRLGDKAPGRGYGSTTDFDGNGGGQRVRASRPDQGPLPRERKIPGRRPVHRGSCQRLSEIQGRQNL